MLYAIKIIENLKDLAELADKKSKVKQIGLVEKLGRQGFHYNKKELFELIAKAVTDTSEKILEETKSNKKQLRKRMNQIFI